MTKFEWEREFLRALADLPAQEQQKALEYFNEIFNDKFDNGLAEGDIVSGFGDPRAAAEQIRGDYYATGDSAAFASGGGVWKESAPNFGGGNANAGAGGAYANSNPGGGQSGGGQSGGQNAYQGQQTGGGAYWRNNTTGSYNYRQTYNPSSNAYTHSSDKTVNALLNILLGLVYIFILIFLWTTLIGIIIGGAATMFSGLAIVIGAFFALGHTGTFLLMLGGGFLAMAFGLALVWLGAWLAKQSNLITKDLTSRSKRHFEESAR